MGECIFKKGCECRPGCDVRGFVKTLWALVGRYCEDRWCARRCGFGVGQEELGCGWL